jgi:putative two-component system hydrogenase maturation factor HypX/HoxX
MRILLLSHSFNSLTQRLHVELSEQGHTVSIEFDINDAVTSEAVELFEPDVILAPFLKRAIPPAIWERRPCLVVHPGPPGDRGPAALDWAILDDAAEWGVTVLQANGEMDAGPVWAYRRFAMRRSTKSSLYRNEVTEAAVAAVREAVERLAAGATSAPQLDELAVVAPRWRGSVRQADCCIDWAGDTTDAVLRKIASADGLPGVRHCIGGREVMLHNAARADLATAGARPGEPVARSKSAVALATCDGAVWIGHARLAGVAGAIKLPAARVLTDRIEDLPELRGPDDIRYEEANGVGYLHFPFLNGAMGVDACRRLKSAFDDATARPTRAIVLMGGPDYWSNGLDLNEIEAAVSAADQSWANINAIDDLAEAIVRATDHIVIAAVGGNAGAGGVFLARAADEIWLRRGVVLNPHYKDMGNLYGSELWTYLLPRYSGEAVARRIMQSRLPMGADEAIRLRLVDHIVEVPNHEFIAAVTHKAVALVSDPRFSGRLAEKRRRREADEAAKPLSLYREEELSRIRRNFYGFDPSYHVARYNFVHKVPKSRTPSTIARHRDKRWQHQRQAGEAAQ